MLIIRQKMENIAVITDQDNNGSLWSRIVRLNNFPKSPWVPIHWPPDPLITLTYASEQRHKTPHCTKKSSDSGESFNKSMKVSTRGFTEDLQSKKQFRLWTRSVSAQQLTVLTQVTQMISANMGVTLSHLIYIKSGLVCRNGTPVENKKAKTWKMKLRYKRWSQDTKDLYKVQTHTWLQCGIIRSQSF